MKRNRKKAFILALLIAGGLAMWSSGIERDRQQAAPTASDGEDVSIRSREALALVGLYHLPNQVDAVNLELDEDGTFRWRIDGCDFESTESGQWHALGDALILTPRSWKPSFRWVAGNSFANRLQRMELEAGDRSGEMIATGVVGDKPITQTWASGGVCVVCEGHFGGPSDPSGCTEPFH